MDLATLNTQLNEALNRFFEEAQAYFTHLSQNELYGWIGEGAGFVLLVVGIFLL